MIGTIKTLTTKGFGFILGEDSTEYFFHHSSMAPGAFDRLNQGDAVRFEVDSANTKPGKGPRATDVEAR